MYVIPDDDEKELYVLADGTVTRAKALGKNIGYATMANARIGYKSHFATCTSPESFRKPRKKDRKQAE